MPHIHIEYSANLSSSVNMGEFCETLRATAAGIETFPLAGIRVRAIKADEVSMADGAAKHGFIDIILRMREGRPADVKKDAIDRLFNSAKQFLEPHFEVNSIALSAELQEINAELAPKFGTVQSNMGALE